ncbi:MAG TPA: peroxiredoxin [Gammaproteobacteria bacterium]|nr:peroxiredoxin [Gammaproteobacteria bacterium]
MSILVGRQVPDFSAPAVLANGSILDTFHLKDVIHNKLGLIFFYPLDFTFVCPSELIALNNRMEKFKERGVEVIAVSVDSQFTHKAWRSTPIERGGIGNVKFTLVADVNHKICQAFGVEHPEASVAFRAAFLIDTKGFVRSQIVNDLPLGRNIDEILRLFDAIQFHALHGEVCPAGWQKGQEGMQPTQDGVSCYLATHADDL